jgi:hypothetical protein
VQTTNIRRHNKGQRVRRLTTILMAICAFSGAAATLAPARADDPAFLTLGGGYYDVVRGNHSAAEFRAEYWSDYKLWFLRPFVGAMGTSTGSGYGYAGLRADLFLGRRVVLSGAEAVGAYIRGDGQDLGSILEFRSAVELAYRFDNRSRLGVAFYHLSNASIGRINPGTEVLSLFYAIPLGPGTGNRDDD